MNRVEQVCGRYAARLAICDGAGELSFAELWRESMSVACGLASRGLAGRRIGILATPGAPWVTSFLGTLASGGTAVALSALYPPAELRWLVAAGRNDALLVSDDLEPLAQQVCDGRPILRIAELVREALTDELPQRRAESTALVIFTSGTTGRPKAALLTDSNIAALANVLAEAWQFSEEDVLLHTLPLHHVHGIGVALFVALVSGAATRFVTPFQANRVWEGLERATVLMGVPTQHKKLFDAFDAADRPTQLRWTRYAERLRLVTSGSAALPRAVGQRWQALTGRYPLERYGMTEIGIVLSNPVDAERRPATVGLPLPGVELRIVDSAALDLNPGEAGEIWVRAPTVFAGYDADPAATEAAFSSGWFRTGDTAVRSADGYVSILGRTSVDILKSGGYKLSALEIEEVLRAHDGVGDVAVVGVPDDTWGELTVAVVVIAAGYDPEPLEDSLLSWAKTRLAAYKVPRRVVCIDELPRNALGKVTKPELARQVLGWLTR